MKRTTVIVLFGIVAFAVPTVAYLLPDKFTGLDALVRESDAIAIISPRSSKQEIDGNGMTIYTCHVDTVLKGDIKNQATLRIALFQAWTLRHRFPCLVFLKKDNLYKNDLDENPIEYHSPQARGAVIELFNDVDPKRIKGITIRERIAWLLKERKEYLNKKHQEQTAFLDVSIRSLSEPGSQKELERR